MKYYSEITKDFYNSEKEAIKAEEVAIVEKEKQEALKAKKEKDLTEQKKQFAKKIDEAEAKLDKAYKNYKDVQSRCKQELAVAYKEISDAEAERVDAIKNFNTAFGVYRTCYTGERAQKEFDRLFSSLMNSFLLF